MTDGDRAAPPREVTPSGRLDVTVGEVFGIRVLDRGAAGYLWTFEPPHGARSVGLRTGEGGDGTVGGFREVVHLYALDRPGPHAFALREGRPWLAEAELHEVTVDCA